MYQSETHWTKRRSRYKSNISDLHDVKMTAIAYLIPKNTVYRVVVGFKALFWLRKRDAMGVSGHKTILVSMTEMTYLDAGNLIGRLCSATGSHL
jgi:hypothetical protein